MRSTRRVGVSLAEYRERFRSAAVRSYFSAARTSSASGKRPWRCLEKSSSPSATTSNWLFSPGTGWASCPSALKSAARLAARSS